MPTSGCPQGYGKNLGSSNVAVGTSTLGGTDWRTLSSVNGDYMVLCCR